MVVVVACMWACGCVGVWVCGCVGVWVCGCVGVWVCRCVGVWVCGCVSVVSQSEVLGQFYNPNTTPKDKERVVVCLCGTGQELH